MGVKAINSHVEGKKHQGLFKSMNGSFGIKIFTTSQGCGSSDSRPQVGEGNSAQASRSASEDNGTAQTSGSALEVTGAAQASDAGPLSVPVPSATTHTQPGNASSTEALASAEVGAEVSQLRGLNKYILRDEVTNAEILWALNCCFNHMSMSAGGKSVDIFGKMFPDSIIANKMQLGRLKIAYILVYGLAKYFHEDLIDDLKDCGDLVLMFDESMNRCAQRQQMDIAVRFWSSKLDEVSTRYLNSAFLGRARATDLLKAFKGNVPVDLLKRVEMISMDGPNVNFKFLREIKSDLKQEPEDPTLLMMGSCGLHVVHNAFKTGAVATGWNIPLFLRSAFNIFDDNPTRKSVYLSESADKNDVNDGKKGEQVELSAKFPLPFSPVRWLCNGPVAENAMKIMPNLRKFVDYVESDRADISIVSQSYQNVVKALKDPLLMCKLAFFANTARKLEPFMRDFQSNDCLAAFLFTELNDLLADVMRGFVKGNVIAEASNLSSVDVEDKKNLIPVKDFKFSHSVRAELQKVKVKDVDILIFKQQCVDFLKAICKKIVDKSPLKYSLCKAITFCDPAVISKSKDVSMTRLGKCLSLYRDNNRLSASKCDLIESEFRKLISKESVNRAMTDYSRKTQKLDHFWRDVLKSHACSEVLVNFIHSVLILSHGNAFVERGFSINKEMIIENQLECSLVGLRQVYDGVQCKGGLQNVVVDKKIIAKVRNARSEYEEARKKRASLDKNKEVEVRKKRALVDEVKELKAKKLKLILEKEQEIDAIEKRLNELIAD